MDPVHGRLQIDIAVIIDHVALHAAGHEPARGHNVAEENLCGNLPVERLVIHRAVFIHHLSRQRNIIPAVFICIRRDNDPGRLVHIAQNVLALVLGDPSLEA